MIKLNIGKGVIAASLMLGLVPFAAIADDSMSDDSSKAMTAPSTDGSSTMAPSSTPAAQPAPKKTQKPKKPKNQSTNPQQPYNPPATNQPYAEEKVTDVNDPLNTTDD